MILPYNYQKLCEATMSQEFFNELDSHVLKLGLTMEKITYYSTEELKDKYQQEVSYPCSIAYGYMKTPFSFRKLIETRSVTYDSKDKIFYFYSQPYLDEYKDINHDKTYKFKYLNEGKQYESNGYLFLNLLFFSIQKIDDEKSLIQQLKIFDPKGILSDLSIGFKYSIKIFGKLWSDSMENIIKKLIKKNEIQTIEELKKDNNRLLYYNSMNNIQYKIINKNLNEFLNKDTSEYYINNNINLNQFNNIITNNISLLDISNFKKMIEKDKEKLKQQLLNLEEMENNLNNLNIKI
jgi:hypothetical protein